MKKSLLFFLMIIVLSGFTGRLNTGPKLKNNQGNSRGRSIHIDISKLLDNSLKYPYFQTPLKYNYDALEPYIDRMTMEIHYSKHAKLYTDKLNDAIKGTELEKLSLFTIFQNVEKYPAAVRNMGGGYYNHLFFWQVIGPNNPKMPEPEVNLGIAINRQFGSFVKFKADFSQAAVIFFGSGWTWLSVDEGGSLFISSTPNHDNPLMDVATKRGIPVLCIDLWEHAYYLKYQNRRADYVTNFWNVINWQEVEKRYDEAMKAVGK